MFCYLNFDNYSLPYKKSHTLPHDDVEIMNAVEVGVKSVLTEVERDFGPQLDGLVYCGTIAIIIKMNYCQEFETRSTEDKIIAITKKNILSGTK